MNKKIIEWNTCLFTLLLTLALLGSSLVPAVPAKAASSSDAWGVFIGTHVKSLSKIKGYKYVVIDAQDYTASEIKHLKSGGCIIYSYLSIGTLEKYRSYYKKYKKYSLGKYQNWNSERWIDVSKKAWQNFMVKTLVPRLMKKGVDGLWVDNTDVYYEYHKKKIFNGLVTILSKLHKKKIPIIINGGDVFVKKLLDKKKGNIIDGIMQEEVLTLIKNYKKSLFVTQTKKDQKYFTKYIKRVKKAGIMVSLLEYTKNAKKKAQLIAYCKKNGYSYYIANNTMLK